MFACCFGWRKASKCEKLIKRTQCRLKLLKNKRQSIVKQLRQDVAMLLNIGREDIAYNRVEQIVRDESVISTYELLDTFCEFVIINLNYIRRHKDCPNDINEAISSLIFASARCGELPELFALRKLFAERYGQKFETTAVELLPGNFVSLQVKENLTVEDVCEEIKQRLVNEIARDAGLQPEILALEFTSKSHQQEIEDTGLETLAASDQIESKIANDKEEKAIVLVNSAPSSTRWTEPSHSHKMPMSPISTSVLSSIVQLSSPDRFTEKATDSADFDTPSGFQVVAVGDEGSLGQYRKEERKKVAASSSESLPQLQEEMIVYLDDNDIQELKSSIRKGQKILDQRAFKFKSALPPQTEIVEESCSVDCMDCFESWNKRSLSSISSRKRSTRRAVLLESSSTKDFGTVIYYETPGKKYPPPKHNRYDSPSKQHHRKDAVQKFEEPQRKLKQTPSHSSLNHCYLNEPCYVCTGDDTDCNKEVPSWKQKRSGNTTNQGERESNKSSTHKYTSFTIEQSNSDSELCTFPQRVRRRNCKFETSPCDLFTKPEFVAITENAASQRNAGEQTRPKYPRSKTMPREQKTESHADVLRSNSFSAQSPKHVHPKLPDCDDIEATFRALKKRHFHQNNH